MNYKLLMVALVTLGAFSESAGAGAASKKSRLKLLKPDHAGILPLYGSFPLPVYGNFSLPALLVRQIATAKRWRDERKKIEAEWQQQQEAGRAARKKDEHDQLKAYEAAIVRARSEQRVTLSNKKLG